jgi:DNA-binding PadR family transcriptional regulator
MPRTSPYPLMILEILSRRATHMIDIQNEINSIVVPKGRFYAYSALWRQLYRMEREDLIIKEPSRTEIMCRITPEGKQYLRRLRKICSESASEMFISLKANNIYED